MDSFTGGQRVMGASIMIFYRLVILFLVREALARDLPHVFCFVVTYTQSELGGGQAQCRACHGR